MAIPAVHALYRQGYEINWVCGKVVQPLLEHYSWIKPIPVDSKAIVSGGIWSRIINIIDLWKKIGLKRYDLCAILYYDSRYRLLTFPVRARRKWMLSRGSRAKVLLAGRNHPGEYTRLLLDLEDSCREKDVLPVRPDRLPPSPLPFKGNQRRIALVPGAANHLLREQVSGRLPGQVLRPWPVQNYVALVQCLIDRGWEIVLLGGPEDMWVSSYFEQLKVADYIGRLSLPEVISACDSCDAVVTHDTGPLHLAGLSEACLIGIFGPTDPGNFLPRRPYAVGIWGGQGFACRPCYDGRDFAPCKHNACMEQVSPELVLRELDRLLTARSQQTPVPWGVVFPDVTSQMTANSELISLTAHKP